MIDLLLKNYIIVNPTTEKTFTGDIAVDNGIIIEVGENLGYSAREILQGQGRLAVFPGLVDMHVHFRDPGLTYKEDIETGSEAAKAGGFTAVLCMPNTKPPVDSPETVSYIINKGKKTGIKVLTSACITKGMSGEELCDYDALKQAGACALTDDGRPVKNAELMRQALELSNKNGMTVISHCEDLDIINGGIINKGEVSEKLGVKGMDRASEDYVTAREIALAMSCSAHIHIAHVSTKGSIDIIRAAKRDGVKVTCETAPHYFIYTDDKLLSRDADYRMNPPLRTEEDRKAVEQAVIDGTIDCIITDHAPHSADEKSDFLKAPNGVVGLETSLAATLTKLYHTGKVSLQKVAELMSVNPRKILGLPVVNIEKGDIADLTVADLDREWTVVPSKLHSKSKNTVFKGETFIGKPVATISNGKIVYNILNEEN